MFTRHSVACGVLFVAIAAPRRGAAQRFGNEPTADDDRLHASASIYYTSIASNMLNVGAHGQATLVAATWLELQGIAMMNLTGISMFRAEGSVFLGAPSVQDAYRVTGQGGGYVYGRLSRGQKRRRLGVEIGGFLSRHESKGAYYSELGTERRYHEGFTPVSQLAGFAGIKWVTQSRSDMFERSVLYAHVIYALASDVDVTVPSGVIASPFIRFGGRAGMEISNRRVFLKLEVAVTPSVAAPDAGLFFAVGWKPLPGLLHD